VKNILIAVLAVLSLIYPMFQLAAPAPPITNLLPASLLLTDPLFSHHILIAEKSTHKLHLFQRNPQGSIQLLHSYQMASGKIAGDKSAQGDHRTPEGIYQFTSFIPHESLIKMFGKKKGEIYGIGSFVINYPNPVDHRLHKGGSGIWLHSTNDETRIEKGLDSRGCLVVANQDLIDISKYIELKKTPLIVVQDMHYLSRDSWYRNRAQLLNLVNQWIDSWQQEKFSSYINFYHPQKFHDRFRGNYQQFSKYKRTLFQRSGQPTIRIDNISIFQTLNYATITFRQHYSSRSINDSGKKTLYLEKNASYQWKIVSEIWSKLNHEGREDQQLVFHPSMRFFSSEKDTPASPLSQNTK
jgi:murein L,D-transpeptidase YafK